MTLNEGLLWFVSWHSAGARSPGAAPSRPQSSVLESGRLCQSCPYPLDASRPWLPPLRSPFRLCLLGDCENPMTMLVTFLGMCLEHSRCCCFYFLSPATFFLAFSLFFSKLNAKVPRVLFCLLPSHASFSGIRLISRTTFPTRYPKPWLLDYQCFVLCSEEGTFCFTSRHEP